MNNFYNRSNWSAAINLFLLIALFFVCATSCNKKGQNASKDDADKIAAEMLHVTQNAIDKLNILAKSGKEPDQIWDEVKTITESHMRDMGILGERLNSLPSASRDEFFKSTEGKIFENRLNEELKRMKALALELVKDIPNKQLNFGMVRPESYKELLSNPRKWHTESREVIDAKYGFIRTFFLGVTTFTESQREMNLSNLEQIRTRALDGNPEAIAGLNSILKDMVAVYPKDQAVAQYNLGVLYASIGEKAEAEKWLTKAVSQGFQPAVIELHKLNDRLSGQPK